MLEESTSATPTSWPRTPAEADANFARLNGDDGVIPDGVYCYARDPSRVVAEGRYPIVTCPYWALDPARPEHEDGYCAHLKSGDWESEGLSLLWDQVKECRIRDDMPEDEDED